LFYTGLFIFIKSSCKSLSRGSNSQSEYLCNECGASFFFKEGLEKHFQRQHGIYCETCPIDIAVQKITDIFRKKITN